MPIIRHALLSEFGCGSSNLFISVSLRASGSLVNTTVSPLLATANRGEDTKRNLKHVKDRAAPAGQFGDEDHVDLAGLRQRQDLLAFGALLLCPGGDFLPDPHDFVASLLGEGA
jgi:hypothetical protein